MTIPDSEARRRSHLVRALLILAACVVGAVAVVLAVRKAATPREARRETYAVTYTVGFDPAAGTADVAIDVVPGEGQLRQARFRMPEARYTDIEGDGEVRREGDHVVWVPERGRPQTLRYRYRVDDRRGDGGQDAFLGPDWGILRGDDLVPPATVRTTRDADARARLRFVLPDGWE